MSRDRDLQLRYANGDTCGNQVQTCERGSGSERTAPGTHSPAAKLEGDAEPAWDYRQRFDCIAKPTSAGSSAKARRAATLRSHQ